MRIGLAWMFLFCLGMSCTPGDVVVTEPDDDAATDDDDLGPNEPPGAAVIAISPEEPSGADDLVCMVVEEAVDPDGDAVTYLFAWTVHGSETNLVEDTVPGEYTVDGDEWVCTVTPFDGRDEGPVATATTSIGINVFEQVQELSGGPSTLECPQCDFTFDVTYTTISVQGACYYSCWVLFPDGVYHMGYSSEAGWIYLYTGNGYGEYTWYPWYYAQLDGNHIDFHWYGYYYVSAGYWDIDGDTLTGLATNTEGE